MSRQQSSETEVVDLVPVSGAVGTGDAEQTEDVIVEPGETTVRFSDTAREAGERSIEVSAEQLDGSQTADMTVTEADDQNGGPSDVDPGDDTTGDGDDPGAGLGDDESGVGFTPVTAVLAVLAGALVVWIRRRV